MARFQIQTQAQIIVSNLVIRTLVAKLQIKFHWPTGIIIYEKSVMKFIHNYISGY
jgi:hypothetical protein